MGVATTDDCAAMLHSLLPRGIAWPGPGRSSDAGPAAEGVDFGTIEAPGSESLDFGTIESPLGEAMDFGGVATPESLGVMQRLLLAFAAELARIDERAGDLLRESSPGTAVELLAEWEALLGLPGPCLEPPQTIEGRQAAAAAKLSSRDAQTPAFYVGVATGLGLQVSIQEHRLFDAESACDASVKGEDWVFVWDVQSPATPEIPFDCESGCSAPLLDFGLEQLECAIRPLKPAHTIVRFTYGTFGGANALQIDFGTVLAALGPAYDFGTVAAPTGPDLDFGTE